MKLPAHILAVLVATAGCETAVDFERRSAPPAPTPQHKGVPERIEIVEEQPRFAQPPPAAAPITRPAPVIEVKPAPAPVVSHADPCPACGMG